MKIYVSQVSAEFIICLFFYADYHTPLQMVDQRLQLAYFTDETTYAVPVDTTSTLTAVINASDEASHQLMETSPLYSIGMYVYMSSCIYSQVAFGWVQ